MNQLGMQKKIYDEYSIIELKLETPNQISSYTTLFGIDPGTTHLGLAFIYGSSCHIFETKIKRNPDAVERMKLTQEIMTRCLSSVVHPNASSLMIIEGSDYKGSHRQVELAEVRAAAVFWALDNNTVPQIIPPLKIRSKVFGDAGIRAEVQWDLRKYPNAATALSCALYSFML